ncbi:hypothetical protein I4U23_005209 [Adineta vaga]|nr:hypothetical protein I4U23_005209 [Adineta vaga]
MVPTDHQVSSALRPSCEPLTTTVLPPVEPTTNESPFIPTSSIADLPIDILATVLDVPLTTGVVLQSVLFAAAVVPG